MVEDTLSKENGTVPMPVFQLPPPLTPVQGMGAFSPQQREKPEGRDEWEQFVHDRAISRQRQSIARQRADLAVEEEETNIYVTKRESERLQLRFQLERQEQKCDRCGHQFNYTDDGELLPEDKWCDVRLEHCGQKSRHAMTWTINKYCLPKFRARQQAERRARRQAEKLTKTPSGKTPRPSQKRRMQTVSTNGHRRALSARNTEER
jgi:hypothetical protein